MAVRKNPSNGSKPDKLWRDAIIRALKRRVEKGKPTKRLEALADKVVEMGIDGDMVAIKEIGDRLDGRSSQQIFHTEQDKEPPTLKIRYVDPTK